VIQEAVLFTLRLHCMVRAPTGPSMRFVHVQMPSIACGFACDVRAVYTPSDRPLRATVHIDVVSDV
jgi:hypothetical protein